MSGAKRDSTVCMTYQLAATQNEKAGRGKPLQLILGCYTPITYIARNLCSPKILTKLL